MDTEQTTDSTSKNQHPAKKVTLKKVSFLKKLDPETARQLQSIKDRINRKPYGRKVRDSEIIAASVSLLTPEAILKLQVETYSERDRLGIAHEEYQKKYGKLTLEGFIAKLLSGEIHTKKD